MLLHMLCCLVHMLLLSFSICKREEYLLYLATALEGLVHVCEVLSDLKLEGMREQVVIIMALLSAVKEKNSAYIS